MLIMCLFGYTSLPRPPAFLRYLLYAIGRVVLLLCYYDFFIYSLYSVQCNSRNVGVGGWWRRFCRGVGKQQQSRQHLQEISNIHTHTKTKQQQQWLLEHSGGGVRGGFQS